MCVRVCRVCEVCACVRVLVAYLACQGYACLHVCAHATYCDKILVVGDNAVRHCDSSKSKGKGKSKRKSVVSMWCVLWGGGRRMMC